MQGSDTHILTTHTGSLPRPPELVEMFVRLSQQESVDRDALADAIDAATRHCIAQQLDVGIDIVNNGEQPRESFFTYVQHRMSGFSGTSQRPRTTDVTRYPAYRELRRRQLSRPMVNLARAPKATGEVRHVDLAPATQECADYWRLLQAQPHEGRVVESFMTAPSPGIIAAGMLNEYYDRLEDYIMAVATALQTEYEFIVSQDLILQLDCPDLALEHHTSFADRPLADFLRFVDLVINAINQALVNIPRDRVRLHVCWGNYEGPHTDDIPLAQILPRLYQAHVGALVLPFANPRHAHEYACFSQTPLPQEMLLIAGVIDTTTNYVEHPEVVAERIERAAQVIGEPQRLIAGTDCGFDTAAGFGEVAADAAWEKLRALKAGADLASQRLLG